jgi:hypothetical protein
MGRSNNKSKLVLALVVGTIAWVIVAIIFVNTSQLVGQSLQSISASQETPHIFRARCESPSLPRGSVHIVVGGYKYKKAEAGIRFEANHNYLLNLGLTNAIIFWYRRVHANEPLRQVQGPCGIQLTERLLLPNHGRDGAALFDHILEIYDKPPPKSIIFLHGHAAHAWHTSCESVFARTAYVYRDLVAESSFLTNNNPHRIRVDANATGTVRNHMMTLTSTSDGTRNYDFKDWEGVQKANTTRPGFFEEEVTGYTTRSRRLGEATLSSNKTAPSPCGLFLERWKHTLAPYTSRAPSYHSCCASFVVPGDRIHRFPREFYEELQAVLIYEGYPDANTGRFCFEFIMYQLWGDTHGHFSEEQYQRFYDEADGLVHGRRTPEGERQEPDRDVLTRMESCTRVAPPPDRFYVVKRKWRNSLKRLGLVKGKLSDEELEAAWNARLQHEQ